MQKWIKTEEQMPEKGQWVIVFSGDNRKYCEIECYMGLGTKTTTTWDKDGNMIKYDYEYPAWTCGHGDIKSTNPVAWMPLPEPYREKE